MTLTFNLNSVIMYIVAGCFPSSIVLLVKVHKRGLLYNTLISRALYFRATSRTRKFCENEVLAKI